MAIKPKRPAATATTSSTTSPTTATKTTTAAKSTTTRKAAAPKKAVSSKANGKAASQKTSITEEDIAVRAWEIWQSEGCPEGKEGEHWFRAQQELCNRS